MNRIATVAAALLLAGCGAQSAAPELLPAESFAASIDGKQVNLYTLHAGDITLQATNYGARVVSLWTPDREGRCEDIVLGYETLDRYVNNTGERFLGAVVGPYANRIAAGRFTLDGTEYTLPTNDNGQTLHGGMTGLDRVVWDVREATEQKLVLSYLHRDGEEGFPGNLQIRMTYTVTPENEFRVDYEATTDKPTVVNLSHHSFFNLKGEGNGTVLDNVLTIRASRTTPVDSVLIPTGEIADVTGTPFDFRQPHAIGERIGADNEQLRNGAGYDHNWVLDRKTADGIEPAKWSWPPRSTSPRRAARLRCGATSRPCSSTAATSSTARRSARPARRCATASRWRSRPRNTPTARTTPTSPRPCCVRERPTHRPASTASEQNNSAPQNDGPKC